MLRAAKAHSGKIQGERCNTSHPVAVTDGLMSGRVYAYALKEYGRKYPYAGYGGMLAA
jgi:hypothetical protein